MKFNKSHLIYSIMVFTVLSVSKTLPFNDDHFWDDDYEMSTEESSFLESVIYNNAHRATINADDIVPIVQQFKLEKTLLLNLYKKTNIANTRPLHDLPALQRSHYKSCKKNNYLDLTLFYTQTRKAFFTKESPFIESYLAITDNDFLEEFDKLDDQLNDNGDLANQYNIPIVFPLFSQLKLEERRLGGMFTLNKNYECFSWNAQLPLYYIEHNFFLNNTEKKAIENAPLFKQLSNSLPDDDDSALDEFINAHLVNDLIGIGDLRFQAAWNIAFYECLDFVLGLELNLPTAGHFKNGLIGDEFEKVPCQPYFDILQTINLAEKHPEAALELGLDLGVKALDRLARIAAATRLGTEHVGIGTFFESRYYLNDTYSWLKKLRIHYQIPKVETRFFRATKNGNEFNRNYGADSEGDLRFLSQQLVNTFYPYAARALVKPGFVIELINAAHFDCDTMHFEIGYDFWYQSAEQVKLDCQQCSPLPPLDICEGNGFSATQHKVFAQALWKPHWKCYDWRLGVVGDATFVNDGIGKDWTLGLNLGIIF